MPKLTLDEIQDLKAGDIFAHPFRDSAYFVITEVDPMSTRFDVPSRIIRGNVILLRHDLAFTDTGLVGSIAKIYKLESDSIWATSIERQTKVPKTDRLYSKLLKCRSTFEKPTILI